LLQHRVVRVHVGVGLAELLDELADVVSGGRVIAILLLELLQALQRVAVLSLVVGDLEVAEAGLRIDDTGTAVVAAIIAAIISAAIECATVRTAATAVGITTLLAAGLLTLTWLALALSLTWLALARLTPTLLTLTLLALTWLALLTLPALALTLLTLAAAGGLLLEHLAETFQIG